MMFFAINGIINAGNRQRSLIRMEAEQSQASKNGRDTGASKYSILTRAKLQSSERTLQDDEVAQWAGRIAKALEGQGGVQRA
jgi:hypothetical protein